jgi:hypothetical protein
MPDVAWLSRLDVGIADLVGEYAMDRFIGYVDAPQRG